MARHCKSCGKTMQLRHDTFARAGGYTCINRNCPNCPHFRYRNPEGKVLSAAFKAHKVKVGLGL
jgi:hypothetical protein